MKEEKEAEQERYALIQMYQAGFLDGYNNRRLLPKEFYQIGEKCKKAFEFRFMKQIQKGVRKIGRRKKY